MKKQNEYAILSAEIKQGYRYGRCGVEKLSALLPHAIRKI